MLWIALRFPCLPLEAFLRGSPSAEPWAVGSERVVLVCNQTAGALGVRTGMPRSAARALAPALRLLERDPALERRTLEDAATWAGRYTPSVAIVESEAAGHGLLLEVAASLKLFGGVQAIVRGLRAGVAELGLDARLACAPTAQGAWLLTAGTNSTSDNTPIARDSEALAARLRALPLSVLDADTAPLAAVGVRNLGELLALPRNALARRFGPALAEELDRALGHSPDPRRFHVPPEQFHAALELPAKVENAQALVFAARRLIAQLSGFLEARGGGVQRFTLQLFHRHSQTAVEIGLVRPACDAERFALLVRERLSVLALAAPVRRIALDAGTLLPLIPVSGDLLADTLKPAGDWAQLAERLRARLGEQTVSSLAVQADHRPEAAWRSAPVDGTEKKVRSRKAPNAASSPPRFGTRPMWLLERPRRLQEAGDAPCHEGRLELLAGPERIEVGWWDGREAARDYFIARNPAGALLWIYRERYGAQAAWHLHGIFG